jgi:hypothetical protein
MANDKWTHTYHAEAHALSGNLQLPVKQEIKPQAFAKFRDERDGYYSEQAKPYRLEGIISFQSAYTQASGHRSKKPGHGFVTLATAAVEKLNVLEVVTADRLVAQISTDHPEGPGAPSVTFLGTHFDNLRIAGHKVDVDLNLGFCGDRPVGDGLYITPGSTFMGAVSRFYDGLHADLKNLINDEDRKMEGRRDLPELLRKKYDKGLLTAGGIAAQGEKAKVECSLVKNVEIAGVGKSFGHAIHVPDFGKIFLAELTVSYDKERHATFNLTMIRLEMGCIADGTTGVGTCNVNGGGSGPGGGR